MSDSWLACISSPTTTPNKSNTGESVTLCFMHHHNSLIFYASSTLLLKICWKVCIWIFSIANYKQYLECFCNINKIQITTSSLPLLNEQRMWESMNTLILIINSFTSSFTKPLGYHSHLLISQQSNQNAESYCTVYYYTLICFVMWIE